MSVGEVALAVMLGVLGAAAVILICANIVGAFPEWRENQRYRRQYHRDTGRWPW